MTRFNNGLPHPCPAPGPGWWASRDEETLTEGPFDTFEDALSEALGQGCYQEIEPEGYDFSLPIGDPANENLTGWKAGLYVGLYQQRHINLADWFDVDRWLEDLEEGRLIDEYGADEQGDNRPLHELTPDDKLALQESVRLAIWHWQHRRQIKLRCWYMDGSSKFITVPHPEEPD